MEDKLAQDTHIRYNVSNDFNGTGRIRGISSNGVAVLGECYIIEPDEPITNPVYPYSHFAVWRNQLTVID